MAFLGVTAAKDLMLRLPRQESVRIGIVEGTAEENDDGTWSVTVFAREDQVPLLEGLGYRVEVVTTDAVQRARFLELEIDRPEIA